LRRPAIPLAAGEAEVGGWRTPTLLSGVARRGGGGNWGQESRFNRIPARVAIAVPLTAAPTPFTRAAPSGARSVATLAHAFAPHGKPATPWASVRLVSAPVLTQRALVLLETRTLTFGILSNPHRIRNTLNWSGTRGVRTAFGDAVLKNRKAWSVRSAWASMIALIRGWSLRLRLAAAAAVLTGVAGLAGVLVANVTMRSRMANLEAENRDLSQREERVRRELGEAQERSRSLVAEIQKQQSGVPSVLVASLVLLPGVSRAESVREKLVLSAAAQLVHTEIQLEPRDDYFRFHAELRTPSGVEILTRSDLLRRRTTTGTVVAFDVPADALAAGDYELTLKGVPSGRAAEDIGNYYISVQRP